MIERTPDTNSKYDGQRPIQNHDFEATAKLHAELHQNNSARNGDDDYDRYGTVYKSTRQTDRARNGDDDYDRYGTVYKSTIRTLPDGSVGNDGSISFGIKAIEGLMTNQTENPNHSIFREGVDGKVSEIQYENGKKTQFKYYENGYNKGEIEQFTTPDGAALTPGPGGTWVDANGYDTGIHNLQIDQTTGAYGFLDAGNHIVIRSTDGQQTTTSLTNEEITKAAKDINDEENHTMMKMAYANGDKVNEIITSMSTADRVALQRRYEEMFGNKLSDDISKHLNTDDSTRANESLFKANLQNDAGKYFSESHGPGGQSQRQIFLDYMNNHLDSDLHISGS